MGVGGYGDDRTTFLWGEVIFGWKMINGSN